MLFICTAGGSGGSINPRIDCFAWPAFASKAYSYIFGLGIFRTTERMKDSERKKGPMASEFCSDWLARIFKWQCPLLLMAEGS